MDSLWFNYKYYLGTTLIILFVTSNYFNCKKNEDSPVKMMLLCVGMAIMLPILLLLLIAFVIYRGILSVILKLKFGSNFGGLLNGYDAIHAEEESKHSPICILFIIQYNGDSENFYNIAKNELTKKMFASPKTISKLQVILRSFLGYPYYLRNAVTTVDCIKKFRWASCPTENLQKNDLIQLLIDHSSDPLPNNGEALWDIYVGTQPVIWKNTVDNNDVKHYPILFRFHHSLGDAWDIFTTFVRVFANATHGQQNLSNRSLIVNKLNFYSNIYNSLMSIVKQLYVLWLFPSTILCQILRAGYDSNILHGPTLRYQRIFAFNVEQTSHYLPVIKRIKSKVPGATVVDVFLTAVSASLNDYFKKNCTEIPEYIAIAVPELPTATALVTITPEKLQNQTTYNCNSIMFSIVKLPININGATVSISNRLTLIKNAISKFRNHKEYESVQWFKTLIFGLCPQPIIKLFMHLIKVTAMFSNVPGIPSMTVMDGHVVKDIVAFGFSKKQTGVSFMTFSYEGRLQMTLSVDKNLISNQEDVQGILDDVYKYIDLLDKEIA